MHKKSPAIICCLLGILLLTACKEKRELAGVYVAKKKNLLIVTYLKLNKDKTFEVLSEGDIGGQFIGRGKWLRKKDTLTLTSDTVPSVYSVICSDAPLSSKMDFEIKEKVNFALKPLPLATVSLNKTLLESKDGGVYEAPVQRIDSLRINYANESYRVPVTGLHGNKITVIFDFSKSSATYIPDRYWLIKGNRLINLDRHIKLIKCDLATRSWGKL